MSMQSSTDPTSFQDQLDKFRISGELNCGDERLKETYVYAREIAKRNKTLVWAVSQANYEAHDRQQIDFIRCWTVTHR